MITDEEKLAMYQKLTKYELAKMLIERDKIVDNLSCQRQIFIPQYYPVYPFPTITFGDLHLGGNAGGFAGDVYCVAGGSGGTNIN